MKYHQQNQNNYFTLIKDPNIDYYLLIINFFLYFHFNSNLIIKFYRIRWIFIYAMKNFRQNFFLYTLGRRSCRLNANSYQILKKSQMSVKDLVNHEFQTFLNVFASILDLHSLFLELLKQITKYYQKKIYLQLIWTNHPILK